MQVVANAEVVVREGGNAHAPTGGLKAALCVADKTDRVGGLPLASRSEAFQEGAVRGGQGHNPGFVVLCAAVPTGDCQQGLRIPDEAALDLVRRQTFPAPSKGSAG